MKKYTETTKWDESWFHNLEPKYKLFWFYINEVCDHAGVWSVNLALASFRIGETFTEEETLAAFGDKIENISQGKWWIPGYISTQIKGALRKGNKFHDHVLELLAKHELSWRVGVPSHTHKPHAMEEENAQ